MLEKEFPTFLFPNEISENLSNFSFEKHEEELISLMVLYEKENRMDGKYIVNLNPLNVLPYEFVKENGALNIIRTYNKLQEIFGDYFWKILEYVKETAKMPNFSKLSEMDIYYMFYPKKILDYIPALLFIDKYNEPIELWDVVSNSYTREYCNCIYDIDTGKLLYDIIRNIQHLNPFKPKDDSFSNRKELYETHSFRDGCDKYFQFVENESADAKYLTYKKKHKDIWNGKISLNMTEDGKKLLDFYKRNKKELEELT